MADIFDTINNHDRRLRQLETKPIPTATTSNSGLPAGGVQGDMLIKSSAVNYDAEWVEGIPTGGTTGQVLAKASGTDYDMEWVDQSTSSGATTPTFVASSSASNSTGAGTSLVLSMPTGVAEGDLVVIFCASEVATAPSIASGGWTSYVSATTSPATIGRTIFYKFMGATPDTNVTITIAGSNASAALAYAFRNVYTPTGFTHPIKKFASATAASGMPNAPAITTTYANELVFILGALDDDPAGTVGTVTVPSGFTNFLSVDGGNATSGSNVVVMAAVEDNAAAGTVDAAAFGGSGTDDWAAYSMTFWNVSSLTKKEIMVAASDETTALTTGTAKVTFRAPEDMYLNSSYLPRASVTTAPTGATLTVDIDDDGSSIFSTTLTIDASEKTSTTAATPCVLSSSSIADDSEITVDITQVGSTVAGAGLKVTLYYFSEG